MYEYASLVGEVKPDSKDNNLFRYCGEYYDKETEEIYLRARYYQPAVGRFLTRDTYTGEAGEPESLHLYTYCENDGVNMVDPSGHRRYATEQELAGMSLKLQEYYNAILKQSKMRNSPKITEKSQTTTKSKVKKESKVYAVAASDTGQHAVTFKKKYQMCNAKYIRDFLLKKKWTLNAICGALGNIWQESRMNPGAWEVWRNVSCGYGIVQWTPAVSYTHLTLPTN